MRFALIANVSNAQRTVIVSLEKCVSTRNVTPLAKRIEIAAKERNASLVFVGNP